MLWQKVGVVIFTLIYIFFFFTANIFQKFSLQGTGWGTARSCHVESIRGVQRLSPFTCVVNFFLVEAETRRRWISFKQKFTLY